MNITVQTAEKLYKESPKWFQEQLEEFFGKKTFIQRKFTEIKTFQDACDELGILPEDIQESAADTPDEIAYKKLKVIIKAINHGWQPDWNNTGQRKWWPWFKLSSGFGFDVSFYFCDYTFTFVGSRLCFESEEKSNYAAKQFLDIYKDFLI
jgi:hypothetical protein